MKRLEILNTIYTAIVEVSPSAAELLSPRSDKMMDVFFVDLGINSIDYAEITYIVMNKLNVTQPVDIFTCTNRISDVVNILYGLVNKEKNPCSAVGMDASFSYSHDWANAALT